MRKIKNKLLSIPFPDTCIVCGKPTQQSQYACEKCKVKLFPVIKYSKCRTCLGLLHNAQNGLCGSCLKEVPQYSRLISCIKYQGEVRRRIVAFKFYNRPDYHLGFSKLACEVLDSDGISFDAVVCVPLSKSSLKERGYNQSALIAKKIADYFDVPFYDDLIIKVKNTKRQSTLKLADRKKNVHGAFKVNMPERINGKHILLVDDIFTSGSTMREVAKTCAPHTDNITAFTVARAYMK